MTTYIGVYTSLASASVTSTAVTNYVDEGREFHKDRAVKVAATSIFNHFECKWTRKK